MRNRVIATASALLLTFAALTIPTRSFGQVSITVTVAPPDLPVYEQPVCPGDAYIWTPGYWAWDNGDYYWVPGTWVEAPEVGLLWTPAYWGWNGSAYVFYEGYWGPQVGFYGGISYGYGYFGHGYEGGRWDNGHFAYNQAVSHVDITIVHNVYNTTIVNKTVTRVSYNGGTGGIDARPTSDEEAAGHARHVPPVAAQTAHVEAARSNPQLRASANHGRPVIAATPKPGAFTDHGVVPATEAGTAHNAGPKTAIHPSELPPLEHPAPPKTGDPKLDQKYQQQQEKLLAQQTQERQKLQQKQDQDHQRLVQQKADAAAQQKVELQHQQQTQKLVQKHTQQTQKLQTRQQRPK